MKQAELKRLGVALEFEHDNTAPNKLYSPECMKQAESKLLGVALESDGCRIGVTRVSKGKCAYAMISVPIYRVRLCNIEQVRPLVTQLNLTVLQLCIMRKHKTSGAYAWIMYMASLLHAHAGTHV